MPILSRRWIWRIWIFLLVLPLGTRSQSVSDQPLDLQTLLTQLSAQNPALAVQRMHAEAEALNIPQATAWPDPMMGLTVLPAPLLTARGPQRFQWRIEQKIPFPGKLALQGTLAEIETERQTEHVAVLDLTLAHALKHAYYQWAKANAQEALIQTFQERLRAFESAAMAQYEVGTGSQQAVLKAQIERNRLDLQRQTLAEARHQARATIAQLLDVPIATLVGVPALPEPVWDIEAETLIAQAREEHPEATLWRWAEARAETQQDIAQKAFWPDFTVHLTYFDIGRSDLLPTANGEDALGFGIGLNLPLGQSQREARREQAVLAQRTAQIQAAAFAQRVETAITDAVYRLQQKRTQLQWIETVLLPQAESTQAATLSAYTTGQAGFLDLLDSERLLFELHMREINLRTEALTLNADLEMQTGQALFTGSDGGF